MASRQKGGGRKRKPTVLKVIQGTFRKDRAPKNEPKPKKDMPICPKELSLEAKKEWKKMSKELYPLGLLTKLDRAALAIYCQSYADWIKAVEACEKGPRIFKGPKGNPIITPNFKLAKLAYEQMRSMLAEFGLTPGSRSNVSAVPKEWDEENPRDRWGFGIQRFI